MSHVDDLAIHEIERDRFGIMYSGPLQVGECIKVIRVDDLPRETDSIG